MIDTVTTVIKVVSLVINGKDCVILSAFSSPVVLWSVLGACLDVLPSAGLLSNEILRAETQMA